MYEVPSTNFVLMGDWDTSPEPLGKVVIRMVPNPFCLYGQGWQEGTRDMLQALAQEDAVGKRVCDIGTGTGILAIAAAKLGASHLAATDLSLEVIPLAQKNFSVNGINLQIERATVPASPGSGYDLVLANLGDEMVLEEHEAWLQAHCRGRLLHSSLSPEARLNRQPHDPLHPNRHVMRFMQEISDTVTAARIGPVVGQVGMVTVRERHPSWR